MSVLTPEQWRWLRENNGRPLRLLDPDTDTEYVLLPVTQYEQLRAGQAALDPRELYPALARALQDESWDDPQMDEYNRYG